MTYETIVAVFDIRAHADEAVKRSRRREQRRNQPYATGVFLLC